MSLPGRAGCDQCSPRIAGIAIERAYGLRQATNVEHPAIPETAFSTQRSSSTSFAELKLKSGRGLRLASFNHPIAIPIKTLLTS
jgi:hypothetical protein